MITEKNDSTADLSLVQTQDLFAISDFQHVVPIIINALSIYIALIVFTRLAGKRSFSKMSSFDFAITISIGSIIAATILNQSVSFFQGTVGLVSLYILQIILAHFRKYNKVQQLIDNKPLLLMRDGELLLDNMRKSQVTESDIRGKLREANVLQLDQVKAVVFESTGDISVLHTNNPELQIDDYLLEGVQD